MQSVNYRSIRRKNLWKNKNEIAIEEKMKSGKSNRNRRQ